MKKALALIFAVVFALSGLSIMAYAAEASATATAEYNSETSIIIPEVITVRNTSYVVCPYCGKTCGSSEIYASHLNSCIAYKEYQVSAVSNTCYYCGKTLSNERALNEHYAIYVNEKNHIKNCPFSGEDYKDGGCPCQFTLKSEYERHTAMCPYDGQYSTKGYIKLIFNKLKDFLLGAVKGADWGALKGLLNGMDTGLLKDMANAIFGALGLDFKI
jgi:hypothetical protein